MEKKIGVLSCIDEFQSAYSIASMTEAKLKAFYLLGISKDIVYIKPESGEVPKFWDGEVREFKRRIPLKDWNVVETDDDFIPSLEPIIGSMLECLDGIDILIGDDILLQGWYLPYLIAIRVAERKYPHIKVYCNNHSCPSPRKELPFPRDELFRITDNEYILYNNNSDVTDEERMYHAHGRVLSIFNPIDIPKFQGFSPEIEEFYYKYLLYDKDIISVYPARVAGGKAFDKWLRVLASLKKVGANVFGIIIDSYGTGEEQIKMKESLKRTSSSFSFEYDEDWVFSSEAIAGCSLFCNYNNVSALMRIANLFVQTSISETYSLILLEAMVGKQYVVVNEDLRYILTGEVGQYCMKGKFGSILYKTSYSPSFETYCEDLAKAIIDEMRNNMLIKNFVWASKNNNLIRYGRRLLSLVLKEDYAYDVDSILFKPNGTFNDSKMKLNQKGLVIL